MGGARKMGAEAAHQLEGAAWWKRKKEVGADCASAAWSTTSVWLQSHALCAKESSIL